VFESSKLSESELLENISDALLDVQRASAIQYWAMKTRIVSLIQLALSGFLLKTAYWYINFVGIVAALIGVVASFKRKNELVFVVSPIAFYILLCEGIFFLKNFFLFLLVYDIGII
jgi:hypothetical protein